MSQTPYTNPRVSMSAEWLVDKPPTVIPAYSRRSVQVTFGPNRNVAINLDQDTAHQLGVDLIRATGGNQ